MKRFIFSVLVLSVFADCRSSAPSSSASPAGGVEAPRADTVPDFSLQTVEGETFTLSDHVGREVVVISFWATWCRPCLAELPHLDVLYRAEKDRGLVVVAVAMDEPTTLSEVAPTAARLGLTMPVVLDTDQTAVSLYNRSRNAPMTVVISREGEITRSSVGYNPGDEVFLADEVRALLEE